MDRQAKKSSTVSLFTFFTGAGFLDLGFEDAGFEAVFANELIDDFATVYTYSRAQMKRDMPKYGLQRKSIDCFLEHDEDKLYLHNSMKYEWDAGKLVGISDTNAIFDQLFHVPLFFVLIPIQLDWSSIAICAPYLLDHGKDITNPSFETKPILQFEAFAYFIIALSDKKESSSSIFEIVKGESPNAVLALPPALELPA